MKEYIETGKIVTTHGLKGEFKVYPWCDSPEELTEYKTIYFSKGANTFSAAKVLRARVQQTVVILQVEGVETIEQADALRGKTIYVHRDDIELEEGEYLIQDIVGLEVFDADDSKKYGVICDVSKTGANDVYHIKFEDGSVKLIPSIPSVVISRDITAGRMEIRPLKGLFDDED
ncbi:MAG: 16S rRNA processing protein RimM [Oscillospiraceae bacterium]|nr:16S rRNA processing protein RimM [Oscillospiraceae bacterium]MBQ9938214.1 16S rRNA processing protein RimM [Oscillospiraceae bacterium]